MSGSDDREAPFDPPLALASLSGASDAEWALAGAEHAGAAFLGGVALDGPTRAAALAMTDREREEFLPPDPRRWLDRQLSALSDADLRAGVNLRSASLGPLREAAAVCADRGAMVEVNAHCRQAEMCEAGCGEALLSDTERLADSVAAVAGTGATTSVKLRAEVEGVDLPAVARAAVDAGAAIVHVDAMDSESVVADVREAVPGAFLVANNGVRGRETVAEYASYGADAVSVGRPSDDPRVLGRVAAAVEAELAADGGGGRNAEDAEPGARP
ncbi:tRNA-dihydrouridine synthase [Candidatus Halobonum tyrrellensis]|uniref:tRNA-dihydrouridine synthase n=1 Tax=Candidatus Halobonum tyrrellensis TaxID=1431545 RepID=UPI000677B34D|nr:tRNA-dihydrouridine synthase [Candidatus Halobonum tyrrellensis]